MQDGSLNSPARGPAGPFSGNGDTREKNRRETVTKAAERRREKKRARGEDLEDTARGPAGPHSGDDDTRERQRRETVTEATKKRQKKRSREGGSEGGAVSTALDAADDL